MQKQKMRMHYKELFLDYDPRENMSELLQDGINRDPEMAKIKEKQPHQHERYTDRPDNQQHYFHIQSGNAVEEPATTLYCQFPSRPRTSYTGLGKREPEYAKSFKEESSSWAWRNLTDLTDVEVYNCPNLTKLPSSCLNFRNSVAEHIASNKGIDGLNGARDGSGEQLTADWKKLADATVGAKPRFCISATTT